MVTKRGVKSIIGGSGCLFSIYLDGVKLDPRYEKIDDINPETLAGIEYYAGPSSVPIEYARLNNQCGVILMRRYKAAK